MGISHLGRLTGSGTLFSGDVEIGSVRYEIDVVQQGGTKSGQGLIHGDVTAAATSSAGALLRLVLSGGESVQIQLANADPVSGRARISTSGRIPGF